MDGHIVDIETYSSCREIVEATSIDHDLKLSGFEILTATAFLIFATRSVELAVIEVGLGGSGDATNVIPPPLISVLCKIAVDHVEFLGSTVQEISTHKAGIIKAGTSFCVIAPQSHREAIELFEGVAGKAGVSIKYVKKAVMVEGDKYTVRVEFLNDNYIEVHPKMIGGYQLENIASACKVCSLLESFGYNLTPTILAKGIELARNPARLEWIDSLLYGRLCLDGSHNEDGIKALSEYLSTIRLPGVSFSFIVGFSGTKDAAKLLSLLAQDDDQIYPVKFTQPEGMPWIHAMDPVLIGESTENYQDCNGSLERAFQMIDRTKTAHVIICGSLYLAADVYRLLERPLE